MMDRFVAKTRSRSQSVQSRSPADKHAGCSKMAAGQDKRQEKVSPLSSSEDESSSPPDKHMQIAKAVARLLTPTIAETVENALYQNIQQLRQDILAQNKRITEAENRLSTLEDDMSFTHATMQKQDKSHQALLEKIEDLENRSRRNNLRVIGLPESFTLSTLKDICSKRIPELLDISHPCIVERAHRIGPLSSERNTPRVVIAKFLNYADKLDILQKFKKNRELTLDGIKLLLFADYSPDVTRKRKAFSQVCTNLYQKRVKFTLAYPAILYLQSPSGEQMQFKSPAEAEQYIKSFKSTQLGDKTPQRAGRTPRKENINRDKLQSTPRQRTNH